MKLYSVDVKICATAYIKANSPEDAIKIASGMKYSSLELGEDHHQEVPISGRQFEDPDLPDVSLSPAMTIYGPFDNETVAHECDGEDSEEPWDGGHAYGCAIERAFGDQNDVGG